jgi:hypothetical protein
LGLDVVLYDQDDNKIESFEISETLHDEIFNSQKLWRSYHELRKLSKYYSPAVQYKGPPIMRLIDELKRYKMFIVEYKLDEYQALIDKISNPNIRRICIAGD